MREKAAAPEVTVYGDPKFSFAYVPSHLHHMTFELVSRCCVSAYIAQDVHLSCRSILNGYAYASCLPPFSCEIGTGSISLGLRILRLGSRVLRGRSMWHCR